jgi:hypothetical protein
MVIDGGTCPLGTKIGTIVPLLDSAWPVALARLKNELGMTRFTFSPNGIIT